MNSISSSFPVGNGKSIRLSYEDDEVSIELGGVRVSFEGVDDETLRELKGLFSKIAVRD